MNKAGYDPEIIPVTNVNPRIISRKEGSKKLTDKCFSVNVLKDGMISATISNERQIARNETNIDSPINCATNCLLPAPTTLRTPISLALRKERAVARFIKLIQAINKIITATIENILTYSIRPPFCLPLFQSEYK